MHKPMPPEQLRVRVSLIADENQFSSSGWQSAADLRRALSGVGVHIPNVRRLLEWGCGCGRILMRLPVDPAVQEIHGCEIDGEAIDWLRTNYPQFHTIRNAGLPPLPYDDGYFDLIVNHSVLTHLDEIYQDAWLAELRRILSPDGVLVLTVLGPHAYDDWIANLAPDASSTSGIVERSAAALRERGIYHYVDDAWRADFPSFYQSTFHAPWYIFEHWTELFDILSYVPRGSLAYQDMILLGRKREM